MSRTSKGVFLECLRGTGDAQATAGRRSGSLLFKGLGHKIGLEGPWQHWLTSYSVRLTRKPAYAACLFLHRGETLTLIKSCLLGEAGRIRRRY